jgi:flavorubredoxin
VVFVALQLSKWSSRRVDPKVTIAFDTMYERTERMARAIYEGKENTVFFGGNQ